MLQEWNTWDNERGCMGTDVTSLLVPIAFMWDKERGCMGTDM
jgi:hypothetical protein